MSNPGKPEILLHICCAACGAFVASCLKDDFKVTLYYYNPNIFPAAEFKKRLEETERIADYFSLELIKEKYDHARWLKIVAGKEQEPERGARCRICYQDRLAKTAQIAVGRKIVYFTTTLSVSPHKDARLISSLGEGLALKYAVNFLKADFKKKDGFKKSIILGERLGLYRQDYCGCEFSLRV
ncbi:MAG: epoxyqueuosine reductase QueH [Planctomycetes bacterium]|jgi:hypothetical protein|nr:epoxyqueuosine reductase QueH [Planctomycetota bacterium]